MEALIRDDFRCLVTRRLDYYEARRRALQRARSTDSQSIHSLDESSEMTETTECAHIFSQSTNTNLDDPRKSYLATSSWAVIERFGFQEILGELNRSKAHSLTNVLTLSPSVHKVFDGLDLYFEETDIPNRYRVSGFPLSPHRQFGCEEFITFTTSNPQKYPLPSPKYLRIHAACCKVSHMSGTSGKFELEEFDYLEDPDPSEPVFAAELSARLLLLSQELQRSTCAQVF